MSENIVIGNASQIQDDDVARDVNLQRISPTRHKINPAVPRNNLTTYGGHIIFVEEQANFTTAVTVGSGTGSSAGGWIALINKDLSSYIPGGLDKISGIVVKVALRGYAHENKAKVLTYFIADTYYSTVYNSDSIIKSIAYYKSQSHQVVAGVCLIESGVSITTFAPVVYRNGVPYLVWKAYCYIAGMNTANAGWEISAKLNLQGFLF